MPRQVNAYFDSDEFEELKNRKDDADTTWKNVIRAGVEAVTGGESA